MASTVEVYHDQVKVHEVAYPDEETAEANVLGVLAFAAIEYIHNSETKTWYWDGGCCYMKIVND